MRRVFVGIVLALAGASLMLGAGCDDDPPATTDVATDTPTDTPIDVGPDAPNCGVEPTLTSLTTNYFEQSCSNFSVCHGSNAGGGLDLATDPHAALVNVAAFNTAAANAGKLLVVPGDPDNSFIVQKVEGTMAATEGGIMPQGAQEPLDPACSIQALRDWISAGAQDN